MADSTADADAAAAVAVRPLNQGYFCRETLAVTIDSRTADQTAAELRFIREASGVHPPGRVLDVGCGAGRQSIELASLGYRVLGIDKSELFLDEARQRADRRGVAVELACLDARRLEAVGEFDLAISFYTAFGYHTDADNQLVVDRIGRALRPGGAFVLDVTNRDAVANSSVEVKLGRTGDLAVLKENSFDPLTSRRRLDWTYFREDRVVKRVAFDHRLYSLHELVAMFGHAGLRLEAAYRDITGAEFVPGSRKLLVVGRHA